MSAPPYPFLLDRLEGVLTLVRPMFGCYALYANDVLGVEPARVDLLEANLREPVVTPHRWSDARLEEVKEQLRLSIRSMKAYLVEPEANVATLADFEKTEELRICKWCNFRAVCRPELGS